MLLLGVGGFSCSWVSCSSSSSVGVVIVGGACAETKSINESC